MHPDSDHMPPQFAQRFLLWFLRNDLAEEVLGDLEEKFYDQLEEKSSFRAKLNYWFQVFHYLRPFAIRKSKSIYLNHYAMFQSYFKIGWRNLSRQKMYSSIKIGGFAIGIAACLLIALFIHQELSYDRYFPNGDRIYRVFREATFNEYSGKGAFFPSPFAATLQEDYPEIELAGSYNQVPLFGAGSNEVRRADKPESSHEDNIVFADQSLLDIFHVPFLYGNPANALSEPNTIVITKSKADKYFPDEGPLGKILILNNDASKQYTVTGVVSDFPVTSHFRYDFLISLTGKEFYPGEMTNWRNDNYFTYILVREGTDVAALEQKLSAMIENYFLPPRIEAGQAEDIAWVKSMSFGLQPVQDIYLNIDEISDNLNHGDIRYILLFGAIAIIILLIACMNFINLSTARSANRAREVGIRKVVGSQRGSLIKQFLTESFIFSFFSFAIGIALAALLLPYFNLLFAKSLVFPWNEWWWISGLIAGPLLTGLLAGFYPAFYLSSFKPIKVLKGNVSQGGRRSGSKTSSMRNALVIFQFTISIILIVSTLIIDRQMYYILNKKLGFDKDQILLLQGTHTLADKINTFKNELLRLPHVSSASISGYLPVEGEGVNRNNGGWTKEGMNPEEAVSGQQWSVDPNYVKTMGLNIVQGRDFSALMPSDSQAVIINKSLAKALNFEDPIGKQIANYLGEWTVIGVVEDFHFESLKKEIRPLGMYIRPSLNTVAVKINTTTTDMAAMIQSVTTLWNEFSPNQSIRYTFLDQGYAQMYDDVRRIGSIFKIFAILAIIVACLGLFALSSFMIEQRGKEISIRLVLGASINNIFILLTRNFLKLVLIALIFAIPIAWYMMQRWLEDYKYRIHINWNVFLLAGLMAALIAILTISYQSIRAALMNPVDSLRSE